MIPTGFLNLTRRDTEVDRSSRLRAAAAFDLFGGPASKHGACLDFSGKTGPAAPSSNMGGSSLDLYGSTTFKADIDRSSECEARMDRLPVAVQKLATDQGVTSIELLESVAAIYCKSAVMGGQPVQCWALDLGKALGVTTQRSEALLQEAVQRGFIEARPQSYFASKL